MKSYLFLFCLLLGTGISMSSLADTLVINASCNDARYGACTSAQSTSTPPLIMKESRSSTKIKSELDENYRGPDHSVLLEVFDLSDPRFFSMDKERSLFEETLVIAGKTIVVAVIIGGAIIFMAAMGRVA